MKLDETCTFVLHSGRTKISLGKEQNIKFVRFSTKTDTGEVVRASRNITLTGIPKEIRKDLGSKRLNSMKKILSKYAKDNVVPGKYQDKIKKEFMEL